MEENIPQDLKRQASSLIRDNEEHSIYPLITRKEAVTFPEMWGTKVGTGPGKRRTMKSLPIPTPQDIIRIVKSIPDPQIKALTSLLYLLGARISEVARYKGAKTKKKLASLRKLQFEYKEHLGVIVVNNIRCLKRGAVKRKKHMILREATPEESTPQALVGKRYVTADQKVYLEETKYESQLGAHNRKYYTRNIPIWVEGQEELVNPVLDYLDTLEDHEELFPFNRKWAELAILYYTGLFPHFFVHARCTHLVQKYNFDAERLRTWRGWSDSRMSATYVHMDWADLIPQKKV